MRNALLVSLALVSVAGTASAGESAPAAKPPALSKQTKDCIDCHEAIQPGIVESWRRSRHSRVSPAMGMAAPGLERRISAKSVPEKLQSVAVGCYECHSLNAEAHKDNFDHFDMRINIVVTPNDCKTCHPTEADEYAKSKKAHALGNLQKNPVYHALVDTVTGLKTVANGSIAGAKGSENAKAETCYACHGTVVGVEGMRTVKTDAGDIRVPVLTGWPNQGVGRVNPDGSQGACTACHPRHSFAIEVARKPETCGQCHLEPDVPAYNVYKESKHGNIHDSLKSREAFDRVPWAIGRDFEAPTCATCHNSLLTTPDGTVVAKRSHDFGARLWVRLFGLIYSHPQPKEGATHLIKNADGLPLPTTFAGKPASEFLIDDAESKRRQAGMKAICQACHGSSWANGHFARMQASIEEADKMVLAATALVQRAWDAGLADKANPFDEGIEQAWVAQWLFYANSVRYAAAMSGPDYAAFKNGWWELTRNLQQMHDWLAVRGQAKGKEGAGK